MTKSVIALLARVVYTMQKQFLVSMTGQTSVFTRFPWVALGLIEGTDSDTEIAYRVSLTQHFLG